MRPMAPSKFTSCHWETNDQRHKRILYSSSACPDILQSPPSHSFAPAPSLAIPKAQPQTATTHLPVLGLDKVGKALGLLVPVVVVAMAVVVVIIGGANILHLVNAAALRAPLDRAFAGHAEPNDVVGISRNTSASGVLLLASGADEDRVLDGSKARGVQRPHIKDVNALHLAENFETLETSRLLNVGGNGAVGSTGAPQVVNVLDLVEGLDLGGRSRLGGIA